MDIPKCYICRLAATNVNVFWLMTSLSHWSISFSGSRRFFNVCDLFFLTKPLKTIHLKCNQCLLLMAEDDSREWSFTFFPLCFLVIGQQAEKKLPFWLEAGWTDTWSKEGSSWQSATVGTGKDQTMLGSTNKIILLFYGPINLGLFTHPGL